MNSKMNKIGGGKLVLPAIPCRGLFWPATRKRLLTVVLDHVIYCHHG